MLKGLVLFLIFLIINKSRKNTVYILEKFKPPDILLLSGDQSMDMFMTIRFFKKAKHQIVKFKH